MDYNEVTNRLNQLKTEDYVWIIYIGIIFLSWYSNSLERKYIINNDQLSKEKYRKLIILIFSILVIVYIYFFKSSIDDIKKLTSADSEEKKNLVYLSFIGSMLIVISGLIFLYIAIADEDINVELAFN